jgi:hypothetical protein
MAGNVGGYSKEPWASIEATEVECSPRSKGRRKRLSDEILGRPFPHPFDQIAMH